MKKKEIKDIKKRISKLKEEYEVKVIYNDGGYTGFDKKIGSGKMEQWINHVLMIYPSDTWQTIENKVLEMSKFYNNKPIIEEELEDLIDETIKGM